MPYIVRKRGNKWVTLNKDTGALKGTHDTRKMAVSQQRLLYLVEGGGTPRNKRPNKRGYK